MPSEENRYHGAVEHNLIQFTMVLIGMDHHNFPLGKCSRAEFSSPLVRNTRHLLNICFDFRHLKRPEYVHRNDWQQ